MKVTINTIAKVTNSSKATVSRVLNGRPDVSDETRQKILDAIEEYNYSPSSVARGLVFNRTDTIGLILPDITNPFFPEVARGVENKAKENGYSVILVDINNDNTELINAIHTLISKKVDGIIFVQWSAEFSQDVNDLLKDTDIPFVAIDGEGAQPCVQFDNLKASKLAVEYLISKGHRTIGHITGDLKTTSGIARYEGYLKSLEENNIPVNPDLIYKGSYTYKDGYEGMKAIFKSKETPSAIFAANDLIAIGIYDAAYELGIRIPEDLSVVGHDDISFASILRPKLTTILVPRFELGVSCMEALTILMKEQDECNEQFILAPELIIRDSVKGK